MNKAAKVWLMIGGFLILAGCILLGGVMTVQNWDFSKLSTAKYETNNYEIADAIANIAIVTDTADVSFVSSEGPIRVVCYEQAKAKHSVTANDGVLEIRVVDSRKWYDHIGIFLGSPKITVYLPKGAYGALSVKGSTGNVEIPGDFRFESMDITQTTGHITNRASADGTIQIRTDTGDIRMENITAAALELRVSTGKITVTGAVCDGDAKIAVSTGKANLTDIKCKNLASTGNTGDITLTDVIASEKLEIERTTGDVKFDSCDAGDIFVQTDTGSVTGSLLSDKVFITQTDTGRINVPKTVGGGKCQITTDTGNIKISIA